MGRGTELDELAVLRRAVYARDAEPGAAEAYALALAARDAPAEPPEDPAGAGAPVPDGRGEGRRRRSDVTVAAAGVIAIVLVLGGVLAARAPAAAPAPSAPATAAAAPAGSGPQDFAPPPLAGPVLGRFASTSGAVTAHLDGRGRVVVVAARCTAGGTLSIRLSDGSGALLACDPGTDGLSLMQSGKPIGRFTLSTSTTGHPRWAISVGIESGAAG